MPSPPHPRLRNRHSLPRAVSNGAHPSDYPARELWTTIPCDSLEYRRVVPTSESPTIQTELGNLVVAKRVLPACACSSSSQLRAFAHLLPSLKHKISDLTTRRRPIGLRGHYSSKCACRSSPRHSRADCMSI